MSQRLPNGLAWMLLVLAVLLLAANVVLGLTGGVGWAAVFGFIPITLSFALVGALIAVRKASVADLRKALGRVLDEPRFRAAARRMAATLAAGRDDGLVVDELESTALEGATLSHPDPRDPSRR